MTRVGVTGHRRLDVTAALERAIDDVLGRIAVAFSTPLTIVSPLAEGADQLVVRRAIALGHRKLIVPLPLPQDDYLRSFELAEARGEFLRLVAQADEVVVMDEAPSHVDAYHAVGRWVLDHSEVLLAIWDGEPPRGEAGTGAIVDEARERGLPVAWVRVEQNAAHANESAPSATGKVGVRYERL